MKLKINKVCDLSSISVLPPHARRSNAMPTGPQASQLQSQASQQSFSQGISSQHGMFSQLSQNSLNEILTNDQRFGCQERENSVKKISCLPPLSCTREESQMPTSRPSANLIRKWNSASVPDHRCQISEELEHRIGLMETSLSRLGMILDSLQSDVMQVNRGTKEVSLETEGIRQKLILHDSLLHLMNKGQEDIKASLAGGFNSISDQLSKDIYQDKLQEVCLLVSAVPQQMEASILRLQDKLSKTLAKEMQAIACRVKTPNQKDPAPSIILPEAIACRVKTPNQKDPAPSIILPEGTDHRSTLQRYAQPPRNAAVPPKVCVQATVVPRVETGGWKTVKDRASSKVQKHNGFSSLKQETSCRINIESDEEFDGDFSCLLEEKETGKCLIEEVKEETERILKRARRRKRKSCNPIIIN